MTKRDLKIIILIGGFLASILGYSQDQVNVEHHFDIYLLARLSSDYMRETNELPPNLNALVGRDSSNVLTLNFKEISSNYDKAYIEIRFKFSDSRTATLTQVSKSELEKMNWIEWVTNNKDNTGYHGTIQLNYGERFFKIRKITLNEKIGR
jgi:hypothetical protein